MQTTHYPAPVRDLPPQQKIRINWSAVAVFVTLGLALIGGLSGWFGANAREVREITERLTALESQRAEDVRRMERIERNGERVEAKVDRLLERTK